jgi:undecaprenyl-diphosphatase
MVSASQWNVSHGRSVWFTGVASATVCLVLFAGLIAAFVSGASATLDELVRSGIHRWVSRPLTLLAQSMTTLGSIAVIAVFAGVAIFSFYTAGRRRDAMTLAMVMAGASVLENGLKYAIHRARPEAFFGTVPETFSFPSGHALFSLCFYGTLAGLLAGRLRRPARAAVWAAAALLILAIGLSRIYLGVHYPGDVIGGYLVAGFWMSLVYAAGRFERHPDQPLRP